MVMPTCNCFLHSPWCHYEDILIKKILQTHAPDGRCFDSGPLLALIEEIICCITTAKGIKLAVLEELVWADKQKELGHIIHNISSEILRVNSRDRSLHAATMGVLELVRNHSWDMKVIIVLAALAKSYGELWLILHNSATVPLALSIARLKGFNVLMESFGRQSKAIRYLFENMVNVATCISEFEILPELYTNLEVKAMASTKAHIHLAVYWVIRSSVACALSSEQMYTNSVGAKWELWSSGLRINCIQICLRKQLDYFYTTAEKIQSCLQNLFKEAEDDNQKVLSTLFSMKDEFPFRVGLRKVGVADFINKEVILFISNPVIQLEKFLLIVEQLQSHKHSESKNLYEIVWIPIPSSNTLSPFEEIFLNLIIETWPWYSLYKSSLLTLSVLKYMREVWHFHDDPLMVVLDSKGRVTSLNAFDRVAIWGELAYPFSIERERELWEGRRLTYEILLNGMDPLISYWMEDRRTICLYGSNDIQWVRELANKMKGIIEAVNVLELIYVGSNNAEQSKDILATVITERLSRYLSLTKISIFWLRLESIRNLKSRVGLAIESDVIMREINSLFSLDLENKGWLLISEGSGNEILQLYGSEVFDCLSHFHAWGEKINTLGFVGSIRKSLLPPLVKDHCDYFCIIPYSEGMDERNIVCKNCNGPMEKNYMYQCNMLKEN